MNNTLYLECYSGISGDMTVAALLDLGANRDVLDAGLNSLKVDGFKTEISRVNKSGIDACDFNVILDKEHENHDHDMEYLHGEGHPHTHEEHTHEEHTHEQHTLEGHTHEDHAHRNLKDIYEIIDSSDIRDNAKCIAKNIFKVIGQSEAKAHGKSIDEVHFHEVGAVDSIVDIVAVAICIDNLQVKDVVVPVLYEGSGFVRCQHGVLPIPVPAVANIIASHGLNIHQTSTEGEFVTPTGAAIVAALITSDKLPDKYKINGVGIGAGKRTYERPSLLRAMLIEAITAKEDTIYKLETNIDDCTGEALGYVMDKLLKAGARDVNFMPVYMKKCRPGYQLNVVCSESDIEKLEHIIFMETTTIGIRRLEVARSVLNRRIEEIDISIGKAKVKVCEIEGIYRIYPEYDSVIELCDANNMSFQEAYKLVERETYGRF